MTNAIPLVTKGRSEADGSNVDATGSWASTPRPACSWPTSRTAPPAATTRSSASPPSPISGTWHHAAVTYDTATDTWNLYLDGNLERTLAAGGNFTPRPTASSTPPSAPRSTAPASAAGFFNGVLDEVRIWNVARSQAQIQARPWTRS